MVYVYGSKACRNCQSVTWRLEQAGVQFERREFNLLTEPQDGVDEAAMLHAAMERDWTFELPLVVRMDGDAAVAVEVP